MSGETVRERNLRLVRAYVNRELVAGRDFLETRLKNLFPGLLGALLNPVAAALYHAIGEGEIRKRLNRQLDVIAAAAEEADRVGLDAAVAKHADAALDTEEIVHRGDPAHPRFPEARALLTEGFRQRVEILGRALRWEGPAESYDDILRGVLTREEAEGYVAAQLAVAKRLTRLVRDHPGLLRFPAPLRPHLLRLVDDVTVWYEARVVVEMRKMYA